MMYEYKVVMCTRQPDEAYLNTFGVDGWRLIQVVVVEGRFSLYLLKEHYR